MIEPGWRVIGSDGAELGAVDQVVGDSVAGIFNGLAIVSGVFGAPRYLAAERVAGIYQGCVQADIDSAAADELPPHEAAPSVEIRPD
jgi:hypothetical protein